MVKVMVTVDPTMQNQTTTSFSDPTQGSIPNDEFDLGITQKNPTQEQVVSVSSEEPVSSSETNVSFDFSLDLPDSYAEVGESAPVQTNAVATEASSVPQEELPVASSQDVIPFDESAVSPFVSEPSLGESASLDTVLKEDAPSILSEESPQNPPLEESLQEVSLPDSSDGSSQLLDEERLNPDLLLQSDSVVETSEPIQEPISNPSTPSFVTESHQEMDPEVLVQNTISQDEVQKVAVSQPTNNQFLEPQAMGNSTSVLEQNSVIDAQLVQSQEPEVPQGKVLNLDEMITQFSASDAGEGQIPSVQASQDPFSAMKSTIEAHHQNQSEPQSTPISIPVQEDDIEKKLQEPMIQPEYQESMQIQNPLAQNQDVERSLQNINQAPQETSSSIPSVGVDVAAPTLDLDMLTSTPAITPLNNPTPYPNSISSSPQAAQKKWVGVMLGAMGIVLLGAIAFMRYPDMFILNGEPKLVSNPPLITDTELEHGSAEESLEDQNTGAEDLTSDSDEDLVMNFPSVDVELEQASDDSEIYTIDLSDLEDGDKEDNEISIENTDLETLEELDPLGAVEELVGPVNNADLIKQEILMYQQRGAELKEQGDLQSKKTMMKYGLAVEKEAQKLLDQLANGENIDISTWSDQKVKLDDYLDKATNA